ncbi:hypothetical protein PoB_003563300 [Plakobranchus ocellatus]|uniref:CASP-like protein n=1 Tax=Plakobranchus ocellatus TaxID=259542 RepID=A0AAV4AP45_9GAST|nr:hypothetical protein PoB_003563300 [Plakobranchus ocellatus]
MKDILRTRPEKTFYVVGSIFVILHALDRAVSVTGGNKMVFALVDTLIFDALATVILPICLARAAYQASGTTNAIFLLYNQPSPAATSAISAIGHHQSPPVTPMPSVATTIVATSHAIRQQRLYYRLCHPSPPLQSTLNAATLLPTRTIRAAELPLPLTTSSCQYYSHHLLYQPPSAAINARNHHLADSVSPVATLTAHVTSYLQLPPWCHQCYLCHQQASWLGVEGQGVSSYQQPPLPIPPVP